MLPKKVRGRARDAKFTRDYLEKHGVISDPTIRRLRGTKGEISNSKEFFKYPKKLADPIYYLRHKMGLPIDSWIRSGEIEHTYSLDQDADEMFRKGYRPLKFFWPPDEKKGQLVVGMTVDIFKSMQKERRNSLIK
jgi:hypothetical protein